MCAQTLCKTPGIFESIYSHSESYPYTENNNGSSVQMLVTCWGDQPALRVHMRDQEGTYAEVNLPSADAYDGGRVTGVGPLTTWTITRHDGSDHLGFRCDARPEHQISLITSGCAPSSDLGHVHRHGLAQFDALLHRRPRAPRRL